MSIYNKFFTFLFFLSFCYNICNCYQYLFILFFDIYKYLSIYCYNFNDNYVKHNDNDFIYDDDVIVSFDLNIDKILLFS